MGRTEFDPSGTAWIPLTQYQSSLSLDGGEYRIPLQTRAFLFAGAGSEPLALLAAGAAAPRALNRRGRGIRSPKKKPAEAGNLR